MWPAFVKISHGCKVSSINKVSLNLLVRSCFERVSSHATIASVQFEELLLKHLLLKLEYKSIGKQSWKPFTNSQDFTSLLSHFDQLIFFAVSSGEIETGRFFWTHSACITFSWPVHSKPLSCQMIQWQDWNAPLTADRGKVTALPIGNVWNLGCPNGISYESQAPSTIAGRAFQSDKVQWCVPRHGNAIDQA